jgi:anti-sigma factor RsiW
MNTNPDETKLALWLDDELHGKELAAFEAWVANQPQHFAARAEIRRHREMMAAAIPAAEEPPYAEFFNSRISRVIREQAEQPAPASNQSFSWRALFMPLAACAGMVLAFMAGTRMTKPAAPEPVVQIPRAIPVEPVLYTPERGVEAEWISDSDASATVIVLSGVDAIPDETDFSETVSLDSEGEINSTAEAEPAGP